MANIQPKFGKFYYDRFGYLVFEHMNVKSTIRFKNYATHPIAWDTFYARIYKDWVEKVRIAIPGYRPPSFEEAVNVCS